MNRPGDRAARQAAQAVFDRPLLLEAGAGTGKTTTLIARALSWCLGPGWERARQDLAAAGSPAAEHDVAAETLRGVVAITFTEAAAAEMATRLAAALASIVDGDERRVVGFDPRLLPSTVTGDVRRRRATCLLESFDHLTVGTFHAFCYGLLRGYPLEAGLHPDLRVDADGRELEAIARLAVEHWVQEAYSAGEETPFLALAARGIGPDGLLAAVVRWTAEGPPLSVLEADPLAPGATSDFLDSLARRVDEVLSLLGERLADLPEDRVARRVERSLLDSAALLAAPRPSGPAALERLLAELQETWSDTRVARVHEWARDRLPSAEERTRLAELGDALGAASRGLESALRTARALDPALLGAARQALLPLLRSVEAELRRRGVITFSGLLRSTMDLLQGSRAVRERERRRLRLLLVDEFQDTDPVQSRIVRLLALEGPPDLRPSLFVVGDPKQSIYAWRDADLAAYEAFQQALQAAGGALHALDLNFRSRPELLAEVDRVISPVMRYEHGIQPAFRGLHAADERRSRAAAVGGHWWPVEYWVSWSPQAESRQLRPGSYAEAIEVEAVELAADVRRLHDSAGVPWSEIGVLFRKSGSQPPFLDEMRRQGVPFAVTRDRNYYQRREVIDAAAWVRSIVNPTDHLALLTVLRSTIVGVPDAALIPLWSRSFPRLVTELESPDPEALDVLRDVVAEVVRSVPPAVPGLSRIAGWEQSLRAALAALAELRQAYRQDPADVFVRRLRQELSLDVIEAARFQGKFRLANLNRFFRQLEAALGSDDADVHAILRALRLGVMEAREAEEAMPRDAAQDAVQVMTIHTAKGLEFDHVYIPQLHGRTRSGGNELLEASEAAPGDWQYHLFGAQTLGYQRAEERRAHIEAAESVRTLYVAMTRARERLVLIGQWPLAVDPVEPLEARNYVELLQNRPGLPPSLVPAADDPAVHLAGHWDHEAIRFRFLGGAQRHVAGWQPARAPAWLPSGDAVARLAADHGARQAAARRRSARPWSAPMTADTATRLEETAAIFRAESLAASVGVAAPPDAARRAGGALHACLESWQLDVDVATEGERQRRRLAQRLADDPASLSEAERLLDRFLTRTLAARFVDLREHLLGREVPVLLAADEQEGPVAGWAGAIDLIYRDPRSGEPVIVDFKTDRLDAPHDVERRAAAYRPQQARYALAVQRALGLERPPRVELWFLWADAIVAGG